MSVAPPTPRQGLDAPEECRKKKKEKRRMGCVWWGVVMGPCMCCRYRSCRKSMPCEQTNEHYSYDTTINDTICISLFFFFGHILLMYYYTTATKFFYPPTLPFPPYLVSSLPSPTEWRSTAPLLIPPSSPSSPHPHLLTSHPYLPCSLFPIPPYLVSSLPLNRVAVDWQPLWPPPPPPHQPPLPALFPLPHPPLHSPLPDRVVVDWRPLWF